MGERILQVAGTGGLRVGQWVRLVLSDPPVGHSGSGSLVSHLYGGAQS